MTAIVLGHGSTIEIEIERRRGKAVRGTNSRGAKDVCALGHVTFDAIAAEDGRCHRCEITPFFEFIAHESTDVTRETRARLGIDEGSGTVVTLEVGAKHTLPQHDTLLERLARLVPLRNIVGDPRRAVILRALNQGRKDLVRPPDLGGRERLKESFDVPGYPGTRAKLIIKRARRPATPCRW